MEIVDVVVVPLKLNQLIGVLPHVVDIEEAVTLGAVLGIGTGVDHLTLCVEAVVPGGQGQTECFQFGRGHVPALIHEILVKIGNVVVVPLKFNQLICFELYAVLIEVSVARTVPEHHFAICAKLIGPGSDGGMVRPGHAVCIADVERTVLDRIAVSLKARSRLKVVVIAIHALQTELGNAVFTVVDISAIRNEPCIGIGPLMQNAAILREMIPYGLGEEASLNEPQACVHITICAEIVPLPVDLRPGLDIVGGTVIVAGIGGRPQPYPFGQASRFGIKEEGQAADRVGAFGSRIVVFEVEPAVRVPVPALDGLTVQQKEGVRSSENGAGPRGNLAAFTADQRRTHHRIVMGGGRHLNVNRDLSHDRAVPHQPYRYRSFLSVGGKHAPRNSAEAFVGQIPCQALDGKHGKIVCEVQAMRRNGHGAVRGAGIRMNR